MNLNQENLLRLLSDAFSNSNTYVFELLQNARRAKATVVEIIKDDSQLVIKDNGIGFGSDFLSFNSATDPTENCPITVGQSNWDNEIQDEESPYGVGFLAAVMASHSYKIERVNDWTVITLQLKKPLSIPAEQLYGFPLPVYINGNRAIQPDFEIEIEIPDFGVLKVPSIWDFDAQPVLYLQGFPIKTTNQYVRIYQPSLQLHLDPKKFKGRMPDRKELIDGPDYSLFKAAVEPQMFGLYAYFLREQNFCPSLDLYRQLPQKLLDQVVELPQGVLKSVMDREVSYIDVFDYREVPSDFELWNNDFDYKYAPLECFVLYQNEIATTRSLPLPKWANANMVEIEDDLEVIPKNETLRTPHVIIAESFTLKLGQYEVEVSDSFWNPSDHTLYVVNSIEDISPEIFKTDYDLCDDDYGGLDYNVAEEKLKEYKQEVVIASGDDLSQLVRVEQNIALKEKSFKVTFDQYGRPEVEEIS